MWSWVAVLAAAAAVWWRVPPPHAGPIAVLQSGVTTDEQTAAVPFEDVAIEQFHHYAGVACAKNMDAAEASDALMRSLGNVPLATRQRLLAQHLFFGRGDIDAEVVDSNNDVVVNGKSDFYHAKWAIQYHEATRQHSVCLVVAGVQFVAAEVVAGYRNHTIDEVITYSKANCNWLGYCDEIPVMRQRVTQEPIFKRNVMVFKEQFKLRAFMAQELDATVLRAAKQPQQPHLLE